MSRVSQLTVVLAMAFALVLTMSGEGKLEGKGKARRFVSQKYGFSIGVPPRWLVDPVKDTPIFFSFSPSEAAEFNQQAQLPKGGAVISVLAQDALPGPHTGDLSAWAAADARGVSAQIPSIHPFDMPPETHVDTAVVSSYDSATYGPDDQSEHRVNIFWEFREKRFVAHLMYPAHDPKGPTFEAVLFSTVRSMRPLGTPP